MLNSDKSISPRNGRAVEKCFDAGIHIIIATARPPRVANRFITGLPFADYRVFYNGALTTCSSRQLIRHIAIPSVTSRSITTYIAQREPHATLTYEVNDVWYTGVPLSDEVAAQFGARSSEAKPQVVGKAVIEAITPTKILAVGCRAWQEVARQFGDQVNVIATDGGALVQIMNKAASKEAAVRSILHDIGVAPEHAMVFGDDANDEGLFRLCGFPVAMGNAIFELKQQAKYVTESNDNNGVALALEKFVL